MWAIRPRPVERAAASIAAAGAMQSCAILLRSVHPWGPARPSKRPSQVVTWLLCANAAGRCHERLGGTSGNPWAAATTIAAVCIARGVGASCVGRPNLCVCRVGTPPARKYIYGLGVTGLGVTGGNDQTRRVSWVVRQPGITPPLELDETTITTRDTGAGFTGIALLVTCH